MQTTELRTVRHRIQLGAPLPFNVRSADHTLLLARGQWVDNQDQLDSLFERGALVDLSELVSAADRVRQAPREALPRLWKEGLSRINAALLHAPHHGFKGALEDATEPVLALVDRDPDLAIFQILRQNPDPNVAYGVQRSVNCAVTAFLVAHRLAWSTGDMERVFKIALTANLSMLELQGELARQRKPPSESQRRALQSHPQRSCQMLSAAGIADRDWLDAVERHHELEDGSGYPTGTSDVGDLASMVRRADVYTSKLASRSHRDALSADIAGRQMFMEDPGHPMTAALVKEFGVYPPGCQVRLVTGETAIVVQRGPTVTTPVVACLTTPDGRLLPSPVRRETDMGRNAVAGVIGQRPVDPEITADRLMLLTLR